MRVGSRSGGGFRIRVRRGPSNASGDRCGGPEAGDSRRPNGSASLVAEEAGRAAPQLEPAACGTPAGSAVAALGARVVKASAAATSSIAPQVV